MYLSLGEILTLFAVGGLILYFLGATRVRELAVQAVQRASRESDFQLLDQSVHIRRVSLSRDDSGRWRVWRQYRFDYSLGRSREAAGFYYYARQATAVITGSRKYPHASLKTIARLTCEYT